MKEIEHVLQRLDNGLVTLTTRVAELAAAQTRLDAKMAELAESQSHMDQRLNALIDVVTVKRKGRESV
jgi:hypothetical protein